MLNTRRMDLKDNNLQLIVPAAGKGTRLGHLTLSKPKCMIEINGITLIERTLRIAEKIGVARIILVVGYCKEVLISHVESLELNVEVLFLENEHYESTNNILSLYMVRDFLAEKDSLIVESDLIFDEDLLKDLIAKKSYSYVVVDKYRDYMDGTGLSIKGTKITNFNIDNIKFDFHYKTVNVYLFRKDFARDYYNEMLDLYVKSGHLQDYYETPLKVLSLFQAKKLKAYITKRKWFEIDDANDRQIAETIFSEKPYNQYVSTYGGYWRYANKLDFVYLTNLFFPGDNFKTKIKDKLSELISHYPSSQKVVAELLSSFVDIDRNFIKVGNGASELIPLLKPIFRNSVILGPTFKEYQNRFPGCKVVFNFKDLEAHIYKGFNCILVNPNNPTGVIHKREKIINLLQNYPKNKFLIDESFIDFCVFKKDVSLLSNNYLQKFENLCVIKSFGKTHGIGGLRLGGMFAKKLSDFILEDPAIWNINSITEYFMQNFKKYQKEYEKSLDQIISEREFLEAKIAKFRHVKVYKSQGNFVFFKTNTKIAGELSQYMFDSGFIIKCFEDEKLRNHFRIAIRTKKENTLLLNALSEFFNGV